MRFSNSYLLTEESDEEDHDKKNVSEGSQILCPQNSSQDDGVDIKEVLANDCKEELKSEQIAFSRQAFRADIQYEKDHN